MSTDERWVPVVGYEANYLVSDRGRVESVPRARTRGGVLKPRPIHNGYLSVGLWNAGHCRRVTVHVIVAAAFLGPRPEGQQVRHLDGDCTNNCVENLAYGTPAENMADQIRHGRHVNARKTHCSAGHAYAGDNLILKPRGRRQCRECKRRWDSEYKLRTRHPEMADLLLAGAA